MAALCLIFIGILLHVADFKIDRWTMFFIIVFANMLLSVPLVF